MSFSNNNLESENLDQLDQLINNLSNLNIQGTNSASENLFTATNLNMANQDIPAFKSEYLEMVPNFDGNQALLTEFITNGEELINSFYNPRADNFQNKYVLKCLKNKIKGQAAVNIASFNIQTWLDLKNALIATYSDKRDLQTLMMELCDAKQNRFTAVQFFNEIQKNLNLQINFCQTHFTGAKINHAIEISQSLALRVFLKNLNRPLGDYVTTRNPSSLQEALNIITNDYQANDSNFKSFKSENRQNFIKPQNVAQNAFRTNQPYLPIANKPFNFNPNQNFQYPKPTPTNVFKPRPNFSPQNQPTPMSIGTTRYTYRPQPSTSKMRHQNYLIDENTDDDNILNVTDTFESNVEIQEYEEPHISNNYDSEIENNHFLVMHPPNSSDQT